MQFIKDNIEGLVAVLALLVSIWSLRVQRKHNQKSVTPHLHFEVVYNYSAPVAWKLVNNGVGPAIIKDFILVFGRSEVSCPSTVEFEAGLKGLGIPLPMNFHVLDKGDFMKDGSEVFVLKYDEEIAKNNAKALSEIKWRIIYSDVYGSVKTFEYPKK